MHGHLNVRRIGVSESVNRCSVNVKGSGDVRNGFAFQNKATCQFTLIQSKLSWPSKSHSSFLGSFSARTCSLSYQVSLKLRVMQFSAKRGIRTRADLRADQGWFGLSSCPRAQGRSSL